MAYLGHIVSAQGVKANLDKLKTMWYWPRPSPVKALRGFLGLIENYQKFIKRYEGIAVLLTQLLKKGEFHWTKEAEEAFTSLKQVVIKPSVLALPNFDYPFDIECDVFEKAVRVVFMQKSTPLPSIAKH